MASNREADAFKAVTVVLLIGVILALIQHALLPIPNTPVELGGQLVVFMLASLVAIGGHEYAHYVVADECELNPDFKSPPSLMANNLLWLFVFIGLVLLEVVLETQLPVLLSMGVVVGVGILLKENLVVSPGGIQIHGDGRYRFCDAWAALAGPLYDAGLGLGLWVIYRTGFSAPVPIVHDIVYITMFIGLYGAILNALPIGGLDGQDVWREGNALQRALQVMMIGVSVIALIDIW